MKKRYRYAFVIIIITLIIGFGSHFYVNNHSTISSPNVYIGVDAAYSDVKSIEKLVNTVKPYTNFFIIGSNIITYNENDLNQLCQYINDADMSFAPFMHTNPDSFNQTQWAIQAKQTWKNHFWGLFPYDEAGGVQIDQARSSVENGNITLMLVPEADNYTDAAYKFSSSLSDVLAEYRLTNASLMTSDYALYEFDYRGGYNVVLAEFGYNLSKPIQLVSVQRSSHNAQPRLGRHHHMEIYSSSLLGFRPRTL